MTTKIANILQCYALGMGIKQISRSFELSRNTVRRYVRLFQECGIPIKELAAMPSARIQEMFSEGVGRNREPSQRQLELEADRKSTRLNSSHSRRSRMPSSA